MTRPDETPMPDRLAAVLALSVPADHTVKNHKDTAIYGGPFDHDLKKLRAVFNDLRRAGFIALQNHKCCGSCAGADIGCRVEAMDSLPQGAVFYCAQTAKTRDEGWPFYLNFSHTGDNDEDSPLTTVEVGTITCEILHAHGIPYTWDGDHWTSIRVHPLPLYAAEVVA